MAWNEPENNDDKRPGKNDAWGNRPNKGNQGPPDIDEVISSLLKKLSGLFGGGDKDNNGGASNGGNLPNGLLAVIIIGVVIFWALYGFYTVDEPERGVVLRFGKAQEAVVMPGLHWNPPLIDEVTKINVTRVYDETFSNTMLTEDDNIVDLTMSVQYTITDARKYYLEVKDPVVSLQHAAESAIRHVVGGSKMDTVIGTGREQLAQDTQDRLQTYLDNYGTGITVSQVNINRSEPPPEVKAAFDDVIKAKEDNNSYQNEARAYASRVVPEARGFALRQKEEANAYKEQVIARAEGEAQRFTHLLVEYKKSPEVTRERLYIDAIQSVMINSSKVMIDVEGGNNMLYLPLDQIMQKNSTTNTDTARTGNLNSAEIRSLSNQVIQDISARQPVTTRGAGR